MGRSPSAPAPVPSGRLDSLLPALALANLLIPFACSALSRALNLSGETTGMMVSLHEAASSLVAALLLIRLCSPALRSTPLAWHRVLGCSLAFVGAADLAYGLFAYVIQLPPPRGLWPLFYELPYATFSILSAWAASRRALEGLSRRQRTAAVLLIGSVGTAFFASSSHLILIPIFTRFSARPALLQASILVYTTGQCVFLGSALLASLRSTGFREFFLWFSFLMLIGSDFAIRMQEVGVPVPSLSFFDYGWHFSVATASSMIVLQTCARNRAGKLLDPPSPIESLRVLSAALTLASLLLFVSVTWAVTRSLGAGFAPITAADFGGTLITLAITWAFSNVVSLLFSKLLKKTNARLTRHVTRIQSIEDLPEISTAPDEFTGILHALQAMNSRLRSSMDENVRLESLAAFGNIASQVAHDIRSPLAALEILSQDLSALPEDLRVLVRSAVGRIRDIANDLVARHRNDPSLGSASPGATESRSVHLISTVIESVVAEKRLQFRSRVDLALETVIDPSAYALFARIEPAEFKRALSNLLNNSIEAMHAGSTRNHVAVVLEDSGPGIRITIRDNGRGIPREVLERLGRRGETHGKKEGSGLGLHHAIQTLENCQGSLSIESRESEGTSVILELPRAEAPAWFVPEIRLKPQQSIVILDDDPSVHHLWRRRLRGYLQSVPGLSIHAFISADELRDWMRSNPARREGSLMLVDYELSSFRLSGLDLIEELGLADRSLLVTSRHEEHPVDGRVRALGIGMIPKSMAAYVPIRASSPRRPLSLRPRTGTDRSRPVSSPKTRSSMRYA